MRIHSEILVASLPKVTLSHPLLLPATFIQISIRNGSMYSVTTEFRHLPDGIFSSRVRMEYDEST